MRILSITFAAALAALTVTSAAAAKGAERPPVSWLKGEGNFTKSHRAPQAIDSIVVHVTEGAFWGSIKWLKSERSHASSHFIVSRRGRIVQLVHQSDIAWHAGNWKVNSHSVGIEHEGITDDPAGFTAKQYVASARLAAYIARRSLMPIDRRHVIGHAEVPDPNDPGARGGASNHTDPGRYWNWRRYLALVRRFAFGASHVRTKPKATPKPKPPVRLRVESATLYAGQVVRGTRQWRARTHGPVRRVDFLVDGKVQSRDGRAPFAFAGDGLKTTTLANGPHTLELRAYGPKGAWTRRRLTVRVRNVPFAVAVAAVPREVTGVVPVRVTTRGAPARIVRLFVDGRRADHDTKAPYVFRWDSSRVADGPHALLVSARSRDGRTARVRLTVVVANRVQVVSQSLVDGQTVSGVVRWEAQVRGNVERVEFLVDGAVRCSVAAAPFACDWDASAEAPGEHRVVVRAVGRNTAEAAATVTVAAPA